MAFLGLWSGTPGEVAAETITEAQALYSQTGDLDIPEKREEERTNRRLSVRCQNQNGLGRDRDEGKRIGESDDQQQQDRGSGQKRA